MRKRLFVIVAQLQESWGEIEANKATKEVSSFFKLLAKIDSVTATALKVKELLSGAAPFIPLLMQVGDHLIS